MLNYVYFNSDAPSPICEFERVGQKVEENLKNPPLVSHDRPYQIEIDTLVNDGLQLNTILRGHELKHL